MNSKRQSDSEAAADKINRRERSLDEALNESFPASDPPAAITPHPPDR
jgi:hypothetical protein